MAAPTPLPRPPARTALDGFDPIVEHTDGLWTIHAQNDPLLDRGPGHLPSARFDPPTGEFPVLYVSSRRAGVWGEVFGDKGFIELHHDHPDTLQHLSVLNLGRPLRLVTLDEPRVQNGLHANLDVRICVGDDYAACQAWSLEIHNLYPTADGIRYLSRHNGRDVNVCLFVDRCRDGLTVEAIDRIDRLTDDIDTARITHLLSVAHYDSGTAVGKAVISSSED